MGWVTSIKIVGGVGSAFTALLTSRGLRNLPTLTAVATAESVMSSLVIQPSGRMVASAGRHPIRLF
ncbi:hypothetical protein B0T16DRAFT_225789 [Cercophora newfieldiana]|uniref:Uncharacterized protein n=1 Tax=Cercophora newfieldiana TaxID=92897 RepID=A0AA39XXN7_9PEZI|nr:hypothetical protein B0T16DRAFT_225789 [Cercophora newfieldiana]